MTVRAYPREDTPAVRQVFFRAVREGAAAHYTETQRRAWAPDAAVPADWADWLSGMATFVAEEEGRIVGFMALDPAGHLEMAFVLPERMGRGVAQLLLAEVLAEVEALAFG